jgi:Na+-transporting NADH:ubiquinone oxidoreductase subunit NqrE
VILNFSVLLRLQYQFDFINFSRRRATGVAYTEGELSTRKLAVHCSILAALVHMCELVCVKLCERLLAGFAAFIPVICLCLIGHFLVQFRSKFHCTAQPVLYVYLTP